MVKKLPACYGIRKGRGAPVVVHSWSEVVAKVSDNKKFAGGVLPPPTGPACLVFRGAVGAPRP